MMWLANLTLMASIASVTIGLPDGPLSPLLRSLAVIEPKALSKSLPCTKPYSKVNLAPGETVCFLSPNFTFWEGKARKNNCGWIIKTKKGAKLSMDCVIFDLAGRDQLIVKEKMKPGRKLTFRTDNGPSDLMLDSNKISVSFKYKDGGREGSFVCDVTASGSNSTTEPATTAAPSSSCRCGIPNTASRIVGGVDTEVNEYPWQVGLISRNTRFVFCGGTIISNRFIMTAAHCTPSLTLTNFQLLLGGHSTATPSGTEIIVNPVRIIDNPNYNANNQDYDYSIIEIEPLDFSDSNVAVRPACLPDSNDLYENVDATVSGWGALSYGGQYPTILQEVTVPTMSNAACREVYGSSITDRMICAGTDAGGLDSCQGDSGGPLVTPDGDNYELIGVVSWGYGCAYPGVPGVYSRVTAVQDWINNTTASGTTCAR